VPSVDSPKAVQDTVERLGDRRIDQFLDLKNLAPKTKKTYGQQLRWFAVWVKKDWQAVNLNDVRRYKLYLEQEKGLEDNSVALALTTLKSFYTWMMKAGYVQVNPMVAVSIPKPPEPEGRNLEQFQVEALFSALDSRGATQARDTAILCLLFYCGLRANEVSGLNVGDYNGVEVIIREAKHGSTGRVPVNAQTDLALRQYLAQCWQERGGAIAAADPLFVSYSNKTAGARLGYQGIYYMVKAIAQVAGIADIHPHRGRHTFASRLIEEGMDAYLAMQLTRHRSVQAFKTYSAKVRYEAAKTAFLKGQGEVGRKPESLMQMVEGWQAQEGDFWEEGKVCSTVSQSVTVLLKLAIEGRKSAKVKRAIESQVLSRYEMVKQKERAGEYKLMIAIEQEGEVAAVTSGIFWEMEMLAKLEGCFVWHEFSILEG
jgi:integrase/recombinase XerD